MKTGVCSPGDSTCVTDEFQHCLFDWNEARSVHHLFPLDERKTEGENMEMKREKGAVMSHNESR